MVAPQAQNGLTPEGGRSLRPMCLERVMVTNVDTDPESSAHLARRRWYEGNAIWLIVVVLIGLLVALLY